MELLLNIAGGLVCILMLFGPVLGVLCFFVRRAMRRVTEETPFRSPPKRAGTIEGWGCRYLGWKHFDDGTAEATIWVTGFYLPLFPCEKHRLVVHSNPEDPMSESVVGIPLILPIFRFHDQFEPLVELPVSGHEVFHTYLYSYVLMPLWLFGPGPLLYLSIQYCGRLIKAGGKWSAILMLLNAVLIITWILAYVPGMLAHQLHKSRGARPKLDRLIPRCKAIADSDED